MVEELNRFPWHFHTKRRCEREQRDKLIGVLPQLFLFFCRSIEPNCLYRRGDERLRL